VSGRGAVFCEFCLHWVVVVSCGYNCELECYWLWVLEGGYCQLACVVAVPESDVPRVGHGVVNMRKTVEVD